jgi:hypothetical protein
MIMNPGDSHYLAREHRSYAVKVRLLSAWMTDKASIRDSRQIDLGLKPWYLKEPFYLRREMHRATSTVLVNVEWFHPQRIARKGQLPIGPYCKGIHSIEHGQRVLAALSEQRQYHLRVAVGVESVALSRALIAKLFMIIYFTVKYYARISAGRVHGLVAG